MDRTWPAILGILILTGVVIVATFMAAHATQASDDTEATIRLLGRIGGAPGPLATVGDEFEDTMHRTVCTVTIHDDLVIAPDTAGGIHCLDAITGKRYWSYDAFSDIWASPLIVDGKVFVGDQDGYMRIFEMSKTRHDPIEVDMNGEVDPKNRTTP